MAGVERDGPGLTKEPKEPKERGPIDDDAYQELWRWTRRGDAESLGEAIWKKEVDPRSRSRSGKDALMAAAGAGHAECVRILLAFIDPRARDDEGGDALMLAAEEGRADCVELLLSAGADPMAATVFGWTALGLAAARGQLDCVAALLAGSDLDASIDGRTPAEMARACEHPDAAELIEAERARREADSIGRELAASAAPSARPRSL